MESHSSLESLHPLLAQFVADVGNWHGKISGGLHLLTLFRGSKDVWPGHRVRMVLAANRSGRGTVRRNTSKASVQTAFRFLTFCMG
jgi:hypothetical protein